jgi:hypothetical protein
MVTLVTHESETLPDPNGADTRVTLVTLGARFPVFLYARALTNFRVNSPQGSQGSHRAPRVTATGATLGGRGKRTSKCAEGVRAARTLRCPEPIRRRGAGRSEGAGDPVTHLRRTPVDPVTHLRRTPVDPVTHLRRAPVTHLRRAPVTHLRRTPVTHLRRTPVTHLRRTPVDPVTHLRRAPAAWQRLRQPLRAMGEHLVSKGNRANTGSPWCDPRTNRGSR